MFKKGKTRNGVEAKIVSSHVSHRLTKRSVYFHIVTGCKGHHPDSRVPLLLTDLICSRGLLTVMGRLSFASLKKIYIAIRCPKCLLLHSFKAYLSCCLLALQDCFCRKLHSVLLGGQYVVGLPVHLRRPPRADASDALAELSPNLRLRMDEYITFSAIEPFTDPTG